jgi:hypothetical protein
MMNHFLKIVGAIHVEHPATEAGNRPYSFRIGIHGHVSQAVKAWLRYSNQINKAKNPKNAYLLRSDFFYPSMLTT